MRCWYLILIGIVCLAGPGRADTIYWTGDIDGNWSTETPDSNWSSEHLSNVDCGAPDDGDSLVFGAVGASNCANTVNDLFKFDVGGIEFNRSGVGITGNSLTLKGDITATNTTGINAIGLDIYTSLTRTWSVASGGALNVSGSLSGGGGLTKTGGGVLNLSGTNTYTGPTTVSQGELTVSGGDAINDTSALIMEDVTAAKLTLLADETIGSITGTGTYGGDINVGSHTLTVGANNQSTSDGGYINGTGTLIKIGTGTLTLSGQNTQDGGTEIRAGRIAVSSDNSLGAAGSTLSLNGGTLQVSGLGFTNTSRPVNLGASGGGIDVTSVSGDFSMTGGFTGSGGLTKTGAGTLRLLGLNSYTGDTFVEEGTLRLGLLNNLSDSTVVTVSQNATLDFSNYSERFGGLAGAGTVSLGSGTMTLIGARSTSFIGHITGSGNVVMQGTGTLSLSAGNTYTGKTTISAGTISIDGDSAFGAAPIGAVSDQSNFGRRHPQQPGLFDEPQRQSRNHAGDAGRHARRRNRQLDVQHHGVRQRRWWPDDHGAWRHSAVWG